MTTSTLTQNLTVEVTETDLLQVLTKPLEDMTLEEKQKALHTLRKLRTVKLASSKKSKTLFELALAQLDPGKAAMVLRALEAQMEGTQKKEWE